jgi:RNA polymerase sigma-70 factor, ECF subfamily
MTPSPVPASARPASDLELMARIRTRDTEAFAALMRRHNRRLFRTARAILKDDAAAEDALQEAYLAFYRHADRFRGDANVATWLTRIVVNEALQTMRRTRRQGVVVPIDAHDDTLPPIEASSDAVAINEPETAAMRAELRALIERKIDDLPEAFRSVFVLREVEEMTVDEVAQCLDVPEATVRTRLFRAKARLRESIAREIDIAAQDVFEFAGARCDRIVTSVLARLGADAQGASAPVGSTPGPSIEGESP